MSTQKLRKFSIRKKRTKPTQAASLSCPVPPRPKLRKQDAALLARCVGALLEAAQELHGCRAFMPVGDSSRDRIDLRELELKKLANEVEEHVRKP